MSYLFIFCAASHLHSTGKKNPLPEHNMKRLFMKGMMIYSASNLTSLLVKSASATRYGSYRRQHIMSSCSCTCKYCCFLLSWVRQACTSCHWHTHFHHDVIFLFNILFFHIKAQRYICWKLWIQAACRRKMWPAKLYSFWYTYTVFQNTTLLTIPLSFVAPSAALHSAWKI